MWLPFGKKNALSRDRRLRDNIGHLQHRIALRVISAYHTILHISAAVLMGMVPAVITARRYRRTYFRMHRIRETFSLTEKTHRAFHVEKEARAIEEWKSRFGDLGAPNAQVL